MVALGAGRWYRAAMHDRIAAELDQIEQTDQVRILYACESGSRAWGFASADSDWDVRFLYVRPQDWYLTIQTKRDVIERPIDDVLDISGWDLPKALGLFRKSNPPLLEWLQSPIVYREVGSAAERMRALLETYYSPIACLHHYLHMARRNHREYIRGDIVWRKKYLYVLRPVLGMLWIERGLGPVPTEFGRLVDKLVDDPELRQAIDGLLAQKMAGKEMDRGPASPAISQFLNAELARFEAADAPRAESRDPELLDELFRTVLAEAWAPETWGR